MNTRAINAADAVVRRYNSRNPEEIISRRAIKVKDIRYCRDLLGYYSVMLNCEYIVSVNPTDVIHPKPKTHSWRGEYRSSRHDRLIYFLSDTFHGSSFCTSCFRSICGAVFST